MLHFHVMREDYDTSTGHQLEPVEIGITDTVKQAWELQKQDGKQFRLPSAPRHLLHDWRNNPCKDEQCLASRPGPHEKGHGVR